MTNMIDEIALAKRSTKQIYERQARHWNRIRSTSLSRYEKPWLDRFLSTLPSPADLVDLGCGSGVPVAGYFLGQKCSLVGVDYSPTMISLARQRYPEADWIVQDIRQLALNGQYDGIYSWDGFFHLSIEEQRQIIPMLSMLIRPGGSIMLTVGTGEGEVTGTVGGETVYHASLAPEEYQRLFDACGFGQVTYAAAEPDSLDRSIILASTRA